MVRRSVKFASQINVAVAFKFSKKIYYATPVYYVYILQSLKNGNFYIGYTLNLDNRIKKHSKGENLSTKPFRPYRLIYYEAFLSRIDAKHREEYLKSGWGLRSIRKMLKNYLAQNYN